MKKKTLGEKDPMYRESIGGVQVQHIKPGKKFKIEAKLSDLYYKVRSLVDGKCYKMQTVTISS